MIKFSKLFETVYEPRSGDEKNFKDKHIVAKHKTPFESESQFTSNKPKAKRKSDYDAKEDESVYEAAEVHTKRADKEAVIVRAVDPKTGQSKARVIQRRAGEIKIGEEVEYIDEAVKIGAMKLHDGSSIIVTREMADKLNNVLEQLNPVNRVKMEERLMSGTKGFSEILAFAKETV